MTTSLVYMRIEIAYMRMPHDLLSQQLCPRAVPSHEMNGGTKFASPNEVPMSIRILFCDELTIIREAKKVIGHRLRAPRWVRFRAKNVFECGNAFILPKPSGKRVRMDQVFTSLIVLIRNDTET